MKNNNQENQDLVWYVSYGSNLLKERFLYYIEGGYYQGKCYAGCKNRNLPRCNKAFTIPHPLYFGNESRTWGGTGVAFIANEKSGKTLGRAWLVTTDQFKAIRGQEGCSPKWYEYCVKLGTDENGIQYKTFTQDPQHREPNPPSDEYLEVIRRGLKETYPELTCSKIDAYLNTAIDFCN